jgi:hypothetical protein
MLVLFFFLLSNKTAGANHRVCVQNNCFNVSIADTPAERERGLMFVQSLKSDVGMLFIFEQSGLYPFWMKNTLIPLDIVWLDEDKKIVFIKNNALPCGADACPNIVPAAEARYVLEINAGTAERLQWKIGDVMYMD